MLHRRVCVVDSFLAGTVNCAVPTQGALLADHFMRDGLTVLKTSSRPGKVLRAADMVATLVRRRSEYDVALIQVFGRRAFRYAQLSACVAGRLGKRVVLVLRGGTLPDEWRRSPQRLRPLLQGADVIVAPSSYMGEIFRGAGFAVRDIPNFIVLDRYPFKLRRTPAPRLFWMRAFHWQYNPQMAIETLALLKESYPEASLSMGGPDSGELESCRELAARLGVGRSVRFLGFLTKERLLAEAERHDIHLHTNRIDNTPVTLIENMALGLPVVATRVGGVPHLVRDEETALLVGSEDACAAADAVTRLLSDSALAERLSRAGRRLVEERFAWPAVRAAWLSVLNPD
jgi:glycosyltransferase involved in cell wall biosynthesis